MRHPVPPHTMRSGLAILLAGLCFIGAVAIPQVLAEESAECKAARKALAIANAEVKVKWGEVLKAYKAKLPFRRARDKAKGDYERASRVYKVAKKALDAALATLRSKRMNTTVGGVLFGTDAGNEYSAALEVLKQAGANFDSAADDFEASMKTYNNARAAYNKADAAHDAAIRIYMTAVRVRNAARAEVERLCGKKSGIEELIKGVKVGSTQGIINKYKDHASNANQEDIAIEEDTRRGGTSSSSSSSGTSTISIGANCDVNSGSGTSTLSLNGSSFCSVTGAAPTFSSGSKTITCNSGSTVTLSLSCTATNCRLNQTSLTPAGFSFTGINNGINGPFTGVTSFTGTCP